MRRMYVRFTGVRRFHRLYRFLRISPLWWAFSAYGHIRRFLLFSTVFSGIDRGLPVLAYQIGPAIPTVLARAGTELPGAVEMPRAEGDKVPPPAKRFSVLSLSGVSHAAAKRYTAAILITAALPRATVRAIVAEAVSDFRSAELFRNAITRKYWEGQPTHAMWLFVYQSLDDVARTNWICRCQWLSPDLTGIGRPLALKGNDTIDGITIDWNKMYQARAQFAAEHTLSQAGYLTRLDGVMAELEPEMATIIKLHERYQQGEVGIDAYLESMSAAEPRIHMLCTSVRETLV